MRDRNYNSSSIHNRNYRVQGVDGGRYDDYADDRGGRGGNDRIRGRDRFRDRHTVERERNIQKFNRYPEEDDMRPNRKHYSYSGRDIERDRDGIPQAQISRYSDISPAGRSVSVPRSPGFRAQSLDPRGRRAGGGDQDHQFPVDKEEVKKTPILCNKYALENIDDIRHHKQLPMSLRSQSLPRAPKGRHDRLDLAPPSPPAHHHNNRHGRRSHYYDDEIDNNDLELQPVRRPKRRERSG